MAFKTADKNLWLGREFEESEGPISELMLKIPTFTSSPFRIGAGVNKYLDLIAREPLGEVGVGDEVNPENSIRIPVAAVTNNNYKLVQHHEVLDNVLNALREKDATDPETLEAKLRLSKYGARMWIRFLVPDYEFNPGYGHPLTLRVNCFNSVDRKIAVKVRLSLAHGDDGADTVVAGFSKNHDRSLKVGEIKGFLTFKLNQLSTGDWFNASVSTNKFEGWIRTTVGGKWGKQAVDRAYQLIDELERQAAKQQKSINELGSRFSNELGEKNAFLLRHVLSLIAQERKTLEMQEARLGQISKMMDELLEDE